MEESGGTAQFVEAHSRAACANAVAKLRREPVGHKHAKRLARPRGVPEAGVEPIDTEQLVPTRLYAPTHMILAWSPAS